MDLLCHNLSSGGFISYPPKVFLALLQFPFSGVLCGSQLPNEVSEESVLTLENVLSPLHTSALQGCHK